MSQAWNYAAGMADRHAQSGGIFIRLTGDGDKVVGAFCGDPLAREVVWVGDGYENFDAEVHAGRRPSMRAMLNFYVPSEGAMKVIEGGSVWFNDVLKVRDKYGLGKWLFEIERHGEKGSPKTTYTILPEEKLSANDQSAITAARLHDLDALAAGEKPEDEDDRPIAAEAAAELVTRLKMLPRSAVDLFLAEFKAQRVRDLRQFELEAARDVLTEMETNIRRKTDVLQTEVDPFA